MDEIKILGLALLLLIHCIQAQLQLPLNSTLQRAALLDLRSSLGLRSRDWPLKADPCYNWTGVHCQNGHVTGINISGFKRTRTGRLNPRFSVDSLVNLIRLSSFNASGFPLPGTIPDWFGYRLPALQVLDLRSCSVFGSIPGSLGNLSKLNFLYLSDNDLAGSLPASLGQLQDLSVLDLSRNSLTGLIPNSFAALGNLTRLDISSNYLSGQVPSSLGSLSRIQFFNLSDNHLRGFVPGKLGSLDNLVELDLSKNMLSGSLPMELGGLRSLKKLCIAKNGLQGQLSDDLFSRLDQLQFVVLSENRLAGALPVALLSMKSLLRFLDLSGNNFTGVLPSLSSNGSLNGAVFNLSNNMLYGDLNSSFDKFSLIDLSSNYFRGKVANDSGTNVTLDRNCLQALAKQRSSEDCRHFYAGKGLSFDDFGVLGAAPPLSEKEKRKKKWIFILVGLLGGLGFIVILVTALVLILRRCNKGIANQRGIANVGPVPEGDSPLPPKDPTILSVVGDTFTYEQLVHATGNFSATNLIKHGHSGDLFKGTLEGGTTVVVKKVSLHSFKKESYMMELDLFNMVSHARLVPLLGQCLGHETEKLLVYKYMVCGDLASSLYVTDLEADSLQSLDWITRLKIAIGAAEGLSYLHHECNPPLVHRDVQASSILLDDKFEVRLGSLSEVHTQEGDSHQNVLTRLLQKQTSDLGPSGLSTETCAYDTYCFGKVLLELVTGKLGISKSDDAATREWLEQTLSYISIYDKEMLNKIVDSTLIVDEDLLEEVWAMAIVAKSCLNPKPAKRPPMKYILRALENPFKVVREDNFSSVRLQTTSSRRSWSNGFFGSWRHSSSEIATVPGHINREGTSGLKQPGRVGSQGSGGIEHSSSNKRLSNEIFPDPLEMQDMERQDEH